MKKLLPVLLLASCGGENPKPDNIYVPAPLDSSGLVVEPESLFGIHQVDEHFSYQVMISPNGGFGYSIFQDGKTYISQPHIPAVQGLNGFATEEYAATTAEFAISKLQQGIFPPMISVDELDSLGVLNE